MKPRNVSIDLLRVISSVFVVAIHADQITSSATNYIGGISWWFVVILHSIASSAVPLFILVSGYLFIPKIKSLASNNSSKVKIKITKRLIRPLIVWTFIYLIWNYYWKEVWLINWTILGSYGHLYYLTILIGLQLCVINIKHKLDRIQNISTIIKLIIISTVSSILLYTLLNLSSISIAAISFPLYIGMFMLGGTIDKLKRPRQKYLFLGILMTVSLISISAYINLNVLSKLEKLFNWRNSPSIYAWDNLNPLVLLLAALIFLLVTSVNTQLSKLPRLIKQLISTMAESSYALYLVHPIIIDISRHYLKMAIHFVSDHLWLAYIKEVIWVYLTSLVIAFTISYLPFIKNIVGRK